jgi:hypothetical protein
MAAPHVAPGTYGVAVPDTLGVGVLLGVAVTETDGLGDAGGTVVGVLAGDGLDEPAGVAGAVLDGVLAGVWPWAGPTRSGVCTRWPPGARKRNMAAATTPSTATTPPVAAPAAKARRSRRYSV